MIKKKKLLRLRLLYVSITALLFSVNFMGLAGDLSGQAFAQRPDPVPFTATDLAGLQLELEDLEHNGELWGVVLIADGSEVVLHEAFGLADRNQDVANSISTAFNIASIGKQLTATAVLQLAQRGQLDLDDAIGRWIDGLPGSTGETVTVRHLLRMESGWGDYMEEATYQDDPKAFRTVSDYVELIRTLQPEFAPGSILPTAMSAMNCWERLSRLPLGSPTRRLCRNWY